jgi:hypothetical protein
MGVNITRQFPKGDLWGSLDKALADTSQNYRKGSPFLAVRE